MTQPAFGLPFARQSAGIPIPHDVWNGMEEWLEYLAGTVTTALAAVVQSSGSVSVPNGPGSGTGSWNAGRTYPTFDTTVYDPNGMTNLAGGGHANQLITATEGGLYIAFCYGSWGSNTTGFRTLSIDIDGDAAQPIVSEQLGGPVSGFQTIMFASQFVPLDAGQTVAMRVDQNSGGALTFAGARLALARVGLAQ